MTSWRMEINGHGAHAAQVHEGRWILYLPDWQLLLDVVQGQGGVSWAELFLTEEGWAMGPEHPAANLEEAAAAAVEQALRREAPSAGPPAGEGRGPHGALGAAPNTRKGGRAWGSFLRRSMGLPR